MHYEDGSSIVSEGLIKAVAVEEAINNPVVGICRDFTDSLIINENIAFYGLPKGLMIFDKRNNGQLFVNPFYFIYNMYKDGDPELIHLVDEGNGFIKSAREKATSSIVDPDKIVAMNDKYEYLQEILDFSIGKNDHFQFHVDFKGRCTLF